MTQGATLKIPISSEEQRGKIFEAERLLSEAGVRFDTSYDVQNHVREWQLDFSLKNATLKCR